MSTLNLETTFTRQTGVRVPLICGAMYPCSNPELVAAAASAGIMGVIQPLSMVYVHQTGLREGIRKIRTVSTNPIGFNALIEKSSKVYEERMRAWVDIALEEGVRFFVTALGNPNWVVKKVHAVGGVVYHDVTERKWALKALESNVDGLICVNADAGGHVGRHSAEKLYEELCDLSVPLVCAGGIAGKESFQRALGIGYAAVQMGTRFIASEECSAHLEYKNAILKASRSEIVHTERITGVPVSVIETPYIKKVGTKAGALARWLLKGNKTKHWVRMYYGIQSVMKLKKSSMRKIGYKDYLQAGKSVEEIHEILPVQKIVENLI